MSLDEKLYTPAEAAPKLRLEVATLWKWARKKKVKTITIGQRYFIPESELLRLRGCEQPDANGRQKP